MSETEPVSEDELRSLWGVCPAPNFEAWREKHPEAVAGLVPLVSQHQLRRRKLLMRMFNLSAVAAVFTVAIALVSFRGGTPAFAEALKEVQQAKTIAWKHEFYLRATSTDGNRTWLHKMSSRRYFQPPGRYRIENLNAKGETLSIVIRDTRQGKSLSLDPKTQVATLRDIEPLLSDTGPFEWIETTMAESALEFVGQRSTSNGDVNVFRKTIDGDQHRETRYLDFWIAQKQKQLVQFRNSIDNPIDPETDPDRDNPAEKAWKGTRAMGSIESEIKLNLDLEAELFSLEPPAGYKLQQPESPTVSEKQMLEFLAAAVEFGGNVFPDSPKSMVIKSDAYDAIFDKPKSAWSEIEKQIAELVKESQMRGGPFPIMHFVQDHVVPGSFRYIGKGVQLGQSTRLVCWYKLIDGGQYRAVYGDLSVKVVDPKELPLDVAD